MADHDVQISAAPQAAPAHSRLPSPPPSTQRTQKQAAHRADDTVHATRRAGSNIPSPASVSPAHSPGGGGQCGSHPVSGTIGVDTLANAQAGTAEAAEGVQVTFRDHGSAEAARSEATRAAGKQDSRASLSDRWYADAAGTATNAALMRMSEHNAQEERSTRGAGSHEFPFCNKAQPDKKVERGRLQSCEQAVFCSQQLPPASEGISSSMQPTPPVSPHIWSLPHHALAQTWAPNTQPDSVLEPAKEPQQSIAQQGDWNTERLSGRSLPHAASDKVTSVNFTTQQVADCRGTQEIGLGVAAAPPHPTLRQHTQSTVSAPGALGQLRERLQFRHCLLAMRLISVFVRLCFLLQLQLEASRR